LIACTFPQTEREATLSPSATKTYITPHQAGLCCARGQDNPIPRCVHIPNQPLLAARVVDSTLDSTLWVAERPQPLAKKARPSRVRRPPRANDARRHDCRVASRRAEHASGAAACGQDACLLRGACCQWTRRSSPPHSTPCHRHHCRRCQLDAPDDDPCTGAPLVEGARWVRCLERTEAGCPTRGVRSH